MKLILASKSPRRIELIKRLNCPLKIIASKIDESTVPTNLPPEPELRLGLFNFTLRPL